MFTRRASSAALTAGLMIGNVGWTGAISKDGPSPCAAAWDYFAFLANSIVFILIGMNTARPAAAPLGIAGRASSRSCSCSPGARLSIYPLAALFRRARWRLPPRYQPRLFWGGLRGALGARPRARRTGAVPERGAIIASAFVVGRFFDSRSGADDALADRSPAARRKPKEAVAARPARR